MSSPNLLREIDQLTQDFQEAFAGLSPRDLNWKQNPQTWSVAQCIDHLIVINKTYFPIVQELRAGTYKTPWHGRFPFLTRFFGNLVYNSVLPDRKRKIKTFPLWEPSYSELPGNILPRFAEHQTALKELIQSSADLIARGSVIASPANRVVVYTLERAFEIIVTHERRHLNQALEVVEKLKS